MGRIITLSLAVLMTPAIVWGAKAEQTRSPTMIDLSGTDAYLARAPVNKEGYRSRGPGYSSALEERSRGIFPWISQEEQRQRWMAEQEQRAIANEINRTKSLPYPVSGR